MAARRSGENAIGEITIFHSPIPPPRGMTAIMAVEDQLGILFVSAMTVIPAAVLIWIGAILSRQEMRNTPGHCSHCGYCLTGNASGICPECGTRIKRTAQK